jgi:hypothetical protein
MTTVQQPNVAPPEALTYCEVHPDRETSLRCNKCGRLMCVQCAVQTPVGYRCKQCVRQHEDKFFQATQGDEIKLFVICAVLMGIAGAIFNAIGFGGLFLALIVGFPIGGAISEVALRSVQRRRGRYSGEIGAAGAVVGGIAGALIQMYLRFNIIVPELLVRDIGLLLFIGIIAFTVYGRFKMKV